ncbi:MAG: ABC transporter ATP-binding protein [Halanaerobiales bacterium]|jgi:peptide/nickel transport system ATP-binding protein|nr:ABC transporter ATP-binding protein [Halanaerobiales bacterium]HPZ62838.1 ABC transporter ATP-binding protein [Halanaerobiales bacterium]HQD05088.1 ABC transporter ATP-binding protein [Halanaerobiales bacterium]
MERVLDVRNLKVYYFTSKGPVRAVDDISFYINKGETLGVVGESGCGKTTLGTALLNMPTPPGKVVGGEIIIDGTNILELNENQLRKNVRWEKISMVFQGAMNSLTPAYTIEKQMLETLRYHRELDEQEARERIKKYVNLVGLSDDVLKRYPHELSGGMKQRIVIAMALFLEPELVICDEPTTALDVVVQAQIINLLKELKQKLNLSFIFVTHDLATEAEVADRIMVMYAGKIAEIGTNDQIYGEQGPMHPYTSNLLAATPRLHKKVEKLNFIPGSPPDLLNPPAGCRFHLRCPVVMEKCRTEEPPLKEVEKDHYVACWRCYENE